MSVRTYYDILGISKDASTEEIANAKHALAKIYHPDVNLHNKLDTTKYMQEILEAYQILSDPKKRKDYDEKLSLSGRRVFRTFKMERNGEDEISAKDAPNSFTACWNAAFKLNHILTRSVLLFEGANKAESIPLKIFRKIGKSNPISRETTAQLNSLSLQALQYISLLQAAEIPLDYWQPEAMNWLLICWSQNQEQNFSTLFARYDAFVNTKLSSRERIKLHSQGKLFQNNLKKLLAYAS